MGRIVIVIAAVAAIAAGGWSAFWFANKGAAETQIEQALTQLRAAGVDTEAANWRVEGFPFAYVGVFDDMTLTVPATGLRATLPTLSAGVSIDQPDAVSFTLPPSFLLSSPNIDGGEGVEVTSTGMVSVVRPDGAGGVTLALDAEKMRLAPALAVNGAYLELTAVDAEGSVSADRALRLELAAEAFDSDFESAPEPGAQAQAVGADGTGLALELAAEPGRIATALRLGAMELGAGGSDGMEVKGLELTAAAEPKEGGDLTTLFPDRFEGDFWAQLANAAIAAWLDGGAVTGALRAEDLAMAIGPGDFAADQGPFAMETAGVSAEMRLAPQDLGLAFEAARLTIDQKGPLDAGPAAGAQVFYDMAKPAFSASATTKGRFDVAAVAAAPGPEAAAALLEMLRSALAADGAVEISSSSDSYASRTGGAGFGAAGVSIDASGGANTFAMRLDRAALRADVTADDVRYAMVGPLPAAFGFKRLALAAETPLAAAEDPQQGTLNFALTQIDLDEDVWTMIDPGGALAREIPGLQIDGRFDVRIGADLLGPEPATADLPDAFALTAVEISRAELSLLGAAVTASGSLGLDGTLEGAGVAELSGWRGLIEGVPQTPFGGAPAVLGALENARAFIETYGAPTGPDAARFDLRLEAGGLTINDRQFDPLELNGADAPGDGGPAPDASITPAE